jgi:phosphate transport system substrate-binding protein
VTHEVKVVAVSRETLGPFVMPSAQSVNDEEYPIARDLYMYTVGEPEGEIKAYMDWIFSMEAQDIVTELGFVPVISP